MMMVSEITRDNVDHGHSTVQKVNNQNDQDIFHLIMRFSLDSLYRGNAIAIESEASDSLTYIDQSGFACKERYLHCGVHTDLK